MAEIFLGRLRTCGSYVCARKAGVCERQSVKPVFVRHPPGPSPTIKFSLYRPALLHLRPHLILSIISPWMEAGANAEACLVHSGLQEH